MGTCSALHRLDPAAIAEVRRNVDRAEEHENANQRLLEKASVKSWDLDKSLSEPAGGLLRICALLSDAQAMTRVLQAARQFPNDFPDEFRPEDVGLCGIAEAAVVRSAVDVARRYRAPEARGAIAGMKVGLFKRLLGAGSLLRAWNEDDYLWNNWLQLTEAIEECAANNHCLGMETY